MILAYWAPLEADFRRFYMVDKPLELSWRKFMILLRGLPLTSTFVQTKKEEDELDLMSATDRMAYYKNRYGSKLTIDQLYEEIKATDR